LPGLADLLASSGRRARRTKAPGSLVVSAIRWSGLDRWTQAWWPQGIAVGSFDGIPIVLVSWFRKRPSGGVRLTVLDLDSLRYRHVALVDADGFSPVPVHAGGIVWTGDRLLVAATHDGIREFRMSDILHRGHGQFVLPQVGVLDRGEKFRYSFLAEGTEGIIAGEYAKDESGRLARLTLGDGSVVAKNLHAPGIPEMQGALFVAGQWAVSSSRGDRVNGDLWTGPQDDLVNHVGALPPGPEDLAWWPERHQVWGATEHPGKRYVYAVDWPVSR
jgi:hypothetical protein